MLQISKLELLSYGQDDEILEYFSDIYDTRAEQEINTSSDRELVDAYLNQIGIIGYTERIFDLVETLVKNDGK